MATRNPGRFSLNAGQASLTAFVARPGSASAAQVYYKAVKKYRSIPGVVLSSPAIGDKSLDGTLSAGSFGAGAIAFLKGTVYVSIQTSAHVSLAALKALAITALGRVRQEEREC